MRYKWFVLTPVAHCSFSVWSSWPPLLASWFLYFDCLLVPRKSNTEVTAGRWNIVGNYGGGFVLTEYIHPFCKIYTDSWGLAVHPYFVQMILLLFRPTCFCISSLVLSSKHASHSWEQLTWKTLTKEILLYKNWYSTAYMGTIKQQNNETRSTD